MVKLKEQKPKPTPYKLGAVSVPIYRYADRWAIIYRKAKGGKRITVSARTEEAIRAQAKTICLDIARGQISADRLSPDERLQAVAARDLLAPRGLSLDAAARELAAAHDLTGGTGLMEMARFWARHHQAGTSQRTPAEILDVMLKAKAAQKLDAHGLRNLAQTLRKFCARFTGPIGEITASEIRDYLDGLPLAARSRNNVRRDLVTLFRFAQGEKDLVEDRKTEAERVGRQKESKLPPAVYTPRELSEWLGVVREEWLPFLVLGAFAGIRSFEIERMDWSDILWMQEQIYIRPEVAKTGQARYIPLQPNLAAWLLPHQRFTGPIRPLNLGRFNKEFARMAKVLKRPWKQNAIRHSYGSYRLAAIQDLGRLTVEMGNSVAVNRRNYQNPRSPQSALEWFSLVPADAGRLPVEVATKLLQKG